MENELDLAGLASAFDKLEPPEEVVDEEEIPESADSAEESDDSEEAEEDSAEEKPAEEKPQAKFLIPKQDAEGNPVLGEDGRPEMEEVDQTRIAKALEIERNYTVEKEQMAEFVQKAEEQIQTTQIKERDQAAEIIAHAGLLAKQVAGILDPKQLDYLRQTDLAAWAKQIEWQEKVSTVSSQLWAQVKQLNEQSAKIQAEKQEADKQRQINAAWVDLSKQNIDKAALQTIYGNAKKYLGVTNDELDNVMSAKAVLIMKDAIAYRMLKDAKPEAANKLPKSGKIVTSQAPVPRDSAKQAELMKRFDPRKGGGKTADLAALFEHLN